MGNDLSDLEVLCKDSEHALLPALLALLIQNTMRLLRANSLGLEL